MIGQGYGNGRYDEAIQLNFPIQYIVETHIEAKSTVRALYIVMFADNAPKARYLVRVFGRSDPNTCLECLYHLHIQFFRLLPSSSM
jgi:hypothetical protein